MRVLIGLVVLVGSAFLAYSFAFPVYTHRYQLTLEFNVEGKLYEGKSLIAVRARAQPKLLPHLAPVLYSAKGEAVFVDLGERGVLLGLLAIGERRPDIRLTYPGLYEGRVVDLLALEAFDGPVRRPAQINRFISIENQSGRRELTAHLLPLIVVLSDPRKPSTVQWVNRQKGMRLRDQILS
jgi:hypothetical protein